MKKTILDVEQGKKRVDRIFLTHILGIVFVSILAIFGVTSLLIFSNGSSILPLVFAIVILAVYIDGLVFYFLNPFPVLLAYKRFYASACLGQRDRYLIKVSSYGEVVEKRDLRLKTLEATYEEEGKEYSRTFFVLDDSNEEIPLNQPMVARCHQSVILSVEGVEE